MFRLAAGPAADGFASVQHVTQDPASPLYFVQSGEETKKVKIWHGLTAAGEADVACFWGRCPDLDRPDPGGTSYSASREGVYVLEIASDFDPDRLAATAAMIRDFVTTDTGTDAQQRALEASFEERFRRHFPLPELDFDPDDDEDDDAD